MQLLAILDIAQHGHVSILTGGKPPVQREYWLVEHKTTSVSILTGGKPPVQPLPTDMPWHMRLCFNPHRREASGAAPNNLFCDVRSNGFNPHRREASGAAIAD